jgi:hypothetical protein
MENVANDEKLKDSLRRRSFSARSIQSHASPDDAAV